MNNVKEVVATPTAARKSLVNAQFDAMSDRDVRLAGFLHKKPVGSLLGRTTFRHITLREDATSASIEWRADAATTLKGSLPVLASTSVKSSKDKELTVRSGKQSLTLKADADELAQWEREINSVVDGLKRRPSMVAAAQAAAVEEAAAAATAAER